MKRMLINVAHGVRVALIDDYALYDLDIEPTTKSPTVNNIYFGKVRRVERSLGAAFVDYGSDRDGFLPFKEIAREYYRDGYHPSPGDRINIADVLYPGQDIIVQVVKEQRGNKGAALRTYISLAGRYLVLMPNNPRAGGISRQIEGEERDDLKSSIGELQIPEGMGIIVRTAGLGRSPEELQWDLDILLSQWKAIKDTANTRPSPFLIHQESDMITRALRDNLRPEIEEILIDSKEAYENAIEHLKHTRPEFVEKVKFYDGADPLFTHFRIETQIESAFQRTIALPNGASIAIDPTEALTAIDINSAKATEGSDIEETALLTNIAAAKEIAVQLRLRDLGGLIVIDFIDMSNPRHQREVERVLRDELKRDRARVQMGRISRFGLLEMSRQRLQPSLGDANLVSCPRCNGQGTIRGVESLTLSILRVIEEESLKPQTAQVRAQLPIDVATFLMNEKREALIELEKRNEVQIVVLANQNLASPHYEISRIKTDEISSKSRPTSYHLVKEKEPESYTVKTSVPARAKEEPAIKVVTPSTPPPPPRQAPRESGLMRRLWDAMFRSTKEEENKSSSPARTDRSRSRDYGDRDNRRPHHGHRNRRHGSDRTYDRPERSHDRDRPRDSRDTRDTRDHRDRPQERSRDRYPERSQTQDRTNDRMIDRPHHDRPQERGHHERTHHHERAHDVAQERPDNRGSERRNQNNRRGSNRNQPRQPRGPHDQTRSREPRHQPEFDQAVQSPVVDSHFQPMGEQPRRATDDEKMMHQNHLRETHVSPTMAVVNTPQEPRVERQVRSEQRPDHREVRVAAPAVTAAPVEKVEKSDPRRDRIGFIKLTPEQAQSTVVKDLSDRTTPITQERPKLKQVVTRTQKETSEPKDSENS